LAAEHFNIDPSLVRVGFVLVTFASGIVFGVIAYIVMMIIIPEETAIEASGTAAKTTSAKTTSAKTTAAKTTSAKTTAAKNKK